MPLVCFPAEIGTENSAAPNQPHRKTACATGPNFMELTANIVHKFLLSTNEWSQSVLCDMVFWLVILFCIAKAYCTLKAALKLGPVD